MTKLSKNAETQQSCITAVKSRFFAQYWGQEVGLQCEGAGKGFTYTITEGTLNDIEIRNDKLLLKPLSKITDKDAEYIMQLEAFIDGFLSDDFLQFLIDLKKGYCNQFEVVDYLRSKGYALPFMEYSVDNLISFGWVQLL